LRPYSSAWDFFGFELNFVRRFIVAQTAKRRVPHQAFGRPRAKLDFGDQLRADEPHVPGIHGRKLFGKRAF
jgi:hypothetical protein